MSSVPALNASPSRAIERPATPPSDVVDPLREHAAAGRGSPRWRPPSRASAARARDPDMAIVWSSLGRQLPPNPKLGRMYVEPIRGSSPIASRTGPMSAPGPLRQAGQLVGERDLQGEERVGAVLDELGLLERDQADRCAVEARTPRPARPSAAAIGRRGRSDDDPMSASRSRASAVPWARNSGTAKKRDSSATWPSRRSRWQVPTGVVLRTTVIGCGSSAPISARTDSTALDIGVAAIVDRRADADEDDLRGRARGPIEDGDVARREHGLERLLHAGLVERDAAVAQLDEALRVGLDELDRVAHRCASPTALTRPT